MWNWFRKRLRVTPVQARGTTTVRDSAGTVRSMSSLEEDIKRMQARNKAAQRLR